MDNQKKDNQKKHINKRLVSPGIVLCFAILAVGWWFYTQRIREVSGEEFLMDTLVTIRTYGHDASQLAEAKNAAFAEMRRIADLTDRFPQPGSTAASESDIFKINEQAGIKPVHVDKDVFTMLTLAQKYHTLTGSVFDITIGPVMDAWDFGKTEQKIPNQEKLNSALSLVNSDDLVLDEEEQTAYLKRPGMSLDLGGIAKGYATERATAVLHEYGVNCAVIDAGGNIRVLGKKDKKTLWRVGIQDPRDSNALVGILSLEDESAVTSGDYNRYFQVDSVRYHHLISPVTGMPGRENMSVTVVTKDAGLADILSTSLFLMPPNEAIKLAESLDGVKAFIVTADRRILVTPGLKDKTQVKGVDKYKVE